MGFFSILSIGSKETERRIKKLEAEWASWPIEELQTRLALLARRFANLVDDGDADALANLEACIRAKRDEVQDTVRSILASIARKEDLVLRIGHRVHHSLRATQDGLLDIWSEVETKEKVEKVLIPIVTMRRKRLGDKSEDTLHSMSLLADQHLKHLEWAKAEPLLVAILDHQDSRTSSDYMMKLAKVHAEQGNWGMAERSLVRIVEGMKEAIEVDERAQLYAKELLAKAYREQRFWKEAEYQYRHVVTERTARGGEDVEAWASMNSLGRLLVELGALDEGVMWLTRAADGRKEQLGTSHRDTVETMEFLVQLYQRYHHRTALAWPSWMMLFGEENRFVSGRAPVKCRRG